MYVLLLLILLTSGAVLAAKGRHAGRRGQFVAGAGLVAATIAFFASLGLVAEYWWFDALGFADRFWTMLVARLGTVLLGALGAWAVTLCLTLPLPHRPATARRVPRLAALSFGGLWGLVYWDELLLFLHRVQMGLDEPILHLDAGFYLFTLPMLDGVVRLLLVSSLLPFLAWPILWRYMRYQSATSGADSVRVSPWAAPLCGATAALALGCALYLRRFHLLISTHGVVDGPGFTDVHVRLPAYLVLALLVPLLGAAPLLPAVRNRLSRRLPTDDPFPSLPTVAASAVAIAAVWMLGLGVAPALMQWLRVEPNEISLEKPYIEHNIRFTRTAFGLDDIEERQFPARSGLDRETVEAHRDVLSEVRLWDWRALDAVYEQFQEIRLYYEFTDVDIDRYRLGDAYREVMVSAREMEVDNLPTDSQTFVNRRFKYTHGYGLTLAGVSDFTAEGLPQLLVRDLPPVSDHPALAVDQPSIYYGESTTEPVVVNSREQEFHYPTGDRNRYVHYQGNGGVLLQNLWRKFVFGWNFDGTRFLLSSYPRTESRVLFHRQVEERLRRVAPFLAFDDDPYIALVDGRLHWIVDAYTTSRRFPYSAAFDSMEEIEYRVGEQDRTMRRRVLGFLDGANYVRNAVKATVDAYSGEVRLYVFEPDDPILQAWRGAFPGLFADAAEMPTGLRAHVRYPEGLLLAQGLVYAKYHMQDPEVFYNQEDLWVRATEKYYEQVQPVEPYYIMWRPPGAEDMGFVQILPFTPKNRQVLIGWIAGMCDPGDYGRLLAYKFPKERRVLGPQQVETKIDQDPYLSGRLSLWDQRGSTVIRGNVLAIPLGDNLIYVEPIYLQADTAAYPELRLVVVMHGDRLSYAETFDQALAGLFTDGVGQDATAAGGGAERPTGGGRLAVQARDAFESYLELQGDGRFVEAAEQLDRLRGLLEQLASEPQPPS